MSTFRGADGFVSLGGAVDGSPLTKGSVSQGASSATLDGGGNPMNGVLRSGDEFTVAGDGQTYTLTADAVIGDPTPNEVVINFTPTVQPGGGWADNSAVTFPSNSIAQITGWEFAVTREPLETTPMEEPPPTAKTWTLDIPESEGTFRAMLDYDDTEQKELIDQVKAGSVPGSLPVLFVAQAGRQFWGNVKTTKGRVLSQRGAIVEVEFAFKVTGALTPNWKS